jgi:transposase InsO family protein
VTEVKAVPYVPLSHPFVERLIGTIRREFLDHVLFWTAADLDSKLFAFQTYFNRHRTHASLKGQTPIESAESRDLNITSYRWQQHCRALYETPTAA